MVFKWSGGWSCSHFLISIVLQYAPRTVTIMAAKKPVGKYCKDYTKKLDIICYHFTFFGYGGRCYSCVWIWCQKRNLKVLKMFYRQKLKQRILNVQQTEYIELTLYGLCIIIYLHNNQPVAYFFLIYFSDYPLHVLKRLTIRHQEEVYCICNLWYLSCIHLYRVSS